MDFYATEDATGTRFNWNVFPCTRSEAEQAALPVGALFTPLSSCPSSTGTCLKCKSCCAIINEFCSLDQPAGVWICSLCGLRNQLLQPVVIPDGPVQEYALNLDPSPLLLVFVVDLCLDASELTELKQQLLTTIASLSSTNCQIALILFDGDVKICEPSSPLLDKQCVIHGSSSPSKDKIAETLGIKSQSLNTHAIPQYFTSPTSPRLRQIITDIQPTHIKTKQRTQRATGLAIQTAVILTHKASTHSSHIFLFTDGPCTTGPGAVISSDKSKPMRSFSDMRRGKAKYISSKKLYDQLALDCDGATSVSMFISGYDQVGLFEMRSLSERTGGVSHLVDSYGMNIFKRTFERLFEVDEHGVFLHMNSGEVSVFTSKDLDVAGFIGPGAVKRQGDNASDQPIGYGLGNTVKLALLSQYHTLGVYFRVRTVAYGTERKQMPRKMYVQFNVKFITGDGHHKLKVVTVEKNTTNEEKMDASFDQEAAIVLYARQIIHDITHDKIDHSEIKQSLNITAIRLFQSFAIYIKGETRSLSLPPTFSHLPQFIFNMLKSPMMTNFNTTPDESTYYTSLFNRADLSDSLLMLQPHLSSFKDGKSIPALLDTSSLDPEAILLMDSFFHVVIHIGTSLAIRRDQGEDIDDLLSKPVKEAIEICSTRFPLPRYVVADQGSSQARFLKSRLNPSSVGVDVQTEEGTLNQFYRKLVKDVVKR